ncbi:uncharacterized protein Z519_07579 [Cladophialophora bantiana CBS 173.52]|uniref:Uncharacterized protein n=1 Tax=Cladophialophora bantiana (strain ATCC 10958 / CBS 173.52 / CDC B-1940 / NIH 8579) TaxID=1442370 RepID=A0A0D2ENP8_CLAB1|nr:uncharacterized protein Z519_07579 [Cladophialophora bantiana CBS 173.52]KIW91611.1 hypothetical protein Z519_07579 [Cladophialophora bantiana CBS 173.52]
MALSKGPAAPSRVKAKATTRASEADIATNTALLFHAEAAQLAKSWLRGAPASDDGQEEDEDHDKDKEEQDLEREFLRNKDMYSETAGVGYRAATTTESTSMPGSAATDPTAAFLRRQLLPGHHRGRAANGNAGTHSAMTARPRPPLRAPRRVNGEGDSDEEESRSGLGKRKRKAENVRQPASRSGETTKAQWQIDQAGKRAHSPGEVGASSGPNGSHVAVAEPHRADPVPDPEMVHVAQSKARKTGTGSYLDELLASRTAKKQRRKNKNKGKGMGLAETEPG